MASSLAPITHYPQGGMVQSAGGDGIFVDASGEPLRIWVDYMFKSLRTIIKSIQAELGETLSPHHAPETQLLILHPSSYKIFDAYCHPAWLSTQRRKQYDKYVSEHQDEDEDWTRKVLLKESWVGKCLQAGRFLGESDNWAGCRVGGPPKGEITAPPVDISVPAVILADVSDPPPATIVEAGLPSPAPAAPELPMGGAESHEMEIQADVTVSDPIVDTNPVSTQNITIRKDDDLESLFGRSHSPSSSAELVQQRDIKRKRTSSIGSLEAPRRSSRRSASRNIGLASQWEDELDSSEEEMFSHAAKRAMATGTKRTRGETDGLVALPDDADVFDTFSSPDPIDWDEQPLASRAALKGPAGASKDASQPQSGRSSRRSAGSPVGLDDLDVTMLDTGPSSRFQSPPMITAPPVNVATDGKIFSGLIFWVDLAIKTRGDLLKEIKTAGGKVSADHAASTHVLIHKYPQQAVQWKDIIKKLAPTGIWFLPPDWAKKSLAEKKRLPEAEYCLPGGPVAAYVSGPSTQAANMTDHTQASVGNTPEKRELPVEKLNHIFDALRRKEERNGAPLDPVSVAGYLEDIHEVYTAARWLELWNTWKSRTGLFGHLPPLPSASAFVPLSESPLKVKTELPSTSPIKKARMGKEDLESIFAKEAWRLDSICMGSATEFSKYIHGKYGCYSPPTWAVYYNDWWNGRGKWTSPRTLQGVLLTVEELHAGPVTKVSTPRREAAALPAPAPSTTVPIATMASALSSYFKHSGDNIVINASLGEHMEALYPAFTPQTWEDLARQWRDGTGKFSSFNARWDGDVPSDGTAEPQGLNNVDTKEPIGRPTKPMPYTEDEILAMGQFVQHQEKEGKRVTQGSWRTFAEVYPWRTYTAWYQYYQYHGERIKEALKRHEAMTEDTKDDYEPSIGSDRSATPVASGSTTKPKKEKVVVSKKEYEDLARFVVDNFADETGLIAQDFAPFSEDYPHRSAARWHAIWDRDKYRSTLMSLVDELRRAAASRRSASSSQSGAISSKQKPQPYTHDEEKAMARFIARNVTERPPKLSDWTLFHKTHRHRAATSWREHYRSSKSRIDPMVEEARARLPAGFRGPAGSQQNAIELGSEDEEEEEVEDIVPIRPPQKRSSRGRDVIVIEED